MFSKSRPFYMKIQKYYYPQLLSWSTILFVKENPSTSILCLVCKEQLCKLHQTRSQTAGPYKDHTWFFEEFMILHVDKYTSHFMQWSTWSKAEIQRLYLLSFPEDPVLPEQKSDLPKEAHSSASTLLVNLWQKMHCHFSADS